MKRHIHASLSPSASASSQCTYPAAASLSGQDQATRPPHGHPLSRNV